MESVTESVTQPMAQTPQQGRVLDREQVASALASGLGQGSLSRRFDSFMREENGKLSSSRLLLMLWGGGVFLIWAIASLRAEALQAIPDSVITVVGVLVGAKTVQRFGE